MDRDLQAEILDWKKRNFFPCEMEHETLALCEETGELSRAVLKDIQHVRGTPEEWHAEKLKEIGDIAITLLSICERLDVRLEDVVLDRWSLVGKRDFVADPIGHGLPES